MTPAEFQKCIRAWFRRHGRDLPWRKTRDPYRILFSEVMLQQTQVSRVVPKYLAFCRAFPTLTALDRAPLAQVLRLWQGLGYNRRAMHLKRLARIVVRDYRGSIPRDPEALKRLPGIGPSTAGAVAAFAFGRRVAFLETNIRRVYIHCFFPQRKRIRDSEILERISKTLPKRNVRQWYYALMDYGAAALRPFENPNRRSAHYARQSPFPGSRRQLRGRILSEIIRERGMRVRALRERFSRDPLLRRHAKPHAFRNILKRLAAEGLIVERGQKISPP